MICAADVFARGCEPWWGVCERVGTWEGQRVEGAVGMGWDGMVWDGIRPFARRLGLECSWLTDTQKYNEWMNENDYLVEDGADADRPALAHDAAANAHAKKKRKIGEESAGAAKGKVRGSKLVSAPRRNRCRGLVRIPWRR